jgi:toxin ParE1/3/4
MSRRVRKAELFIADFNRQFRWYDREAGWELARRYLAAVDRTLEKLAQQPDLGRVRRFPQPELRGIRSFAVERPFNRHLIFYRYDETRIEAWRVIHGARDLPRRLLERPGFEAD